MSGWCGPLQSDLAASWTEALGTAAGVLVGAVGIIFVVRTWRATHAQLRAVEQQLAIERSRDEQQREAHFRDQAEQVAGWIARGISVNDHLHDVYVVNTSGQPVFRFKASLQAGNNVWVRKESRSLAPLLPSQFPTALFGLDPHEIERMSEAETNGQPFGVCFTFRDVRGQDWTRRWNGDLLQGRERFLLDPGELVADFQSRMGRIGP